MGFAKAKFKLVGEKGSVKGVALIDSGAWYTAIDEGLAEKLGVKHTGITLTLISFSGHKVTCREAILNSIALDGKEATSELIAICMMSESINGLIPLAFRLAAKLEYAFDYLNACVEAEALL